jgi:Xaa-Pro aminopeptidase
MYDSILTAHGAVMSNARSGMTGAEIDALARAEIESWDWGHLFVHHTGHGLRFRCHEQQPFLGPGNGDIVEVGMVSSVEPGLYVEGWGGMRLEENVFFTEDGAELSSVFESGLH